MQTSSISPLSNIADEYISRDDETEQARLVQFGGTGDVLSDEDIKSFNLDGFGVNFNQVDHS